MLQSWLDRRNKRETLLRTKYEELGTNFLASAKPLGKLLSSRTVEELDALMTQEDAYKAHLLALVYFPELKHATEHYLESYAALLIKVSAIFRPSDTRVVGLQVAGNQDFKVVKDACSASRLQLEREIERHARKYTKA